MSEAKTIAKNASWLMFATTAQKLIAFLTFTVAARWIGAEVIGDYFFAVSVTSLFVILTDLGLTPVVIREMAQSVEEGRAALSTALRLKLMYIPLGIAAALGYAWLIHVSRPVFIGIALACAVMSADALSLLCYGLIRGKQLLRYEALGMLTGQMITAGVSFCLLFLHLGAIGLIFGLLSGSSWNVIWSMYQARRLKLWSSGRVRWSVTRIMCAAWPFALAGVFVKTYSYIDTLLLRQYHGAVAVGEYAVAYKVTYALQFLPLAFVAALYPGMAAVYASGNTERLRSILAGSIRLMLLVSVPMSAALSALAPKFIPFVYGNGYLASVAPLTILPWVLIPIFLDFPIGSLLNATHRAEKKTMAMGLACVVNVIANLALIPAHGPVGAAWSGVLTFWAMGAAGVFFAWHDLPGMRWAGSLGLRSGVAAAGVWLALHLGARHLSLIPLGVLAVVLTAVMFWGLRLVDRTDADMVRTWYKKYA